ncbi:WD repeat-containing and planar cell polarity effector protein fritz homolog [Physella acuta]|uniref:WD repeat-containing and planar cell polarity effector protein fritz homolog n=1 Tax=Physella acuta TaxID=109671 RepID=UPI0027DE5007|nr:WD repeat-containing and planar cell polarity effector protein fritz homolog [Physella acuta]
MAFCMCELHIWSLKKHYTVPDDVIGFHCYHDKGEQVNKQEQPYNEEKQQFEEGRDITWTPMNKRPERLRDTIKEVEDLLAQFTCINTRWRNRQVLQLLLSNACIVTLFISGHSGDIDRIFIDKSLVGKLSCETICDACLTDQFFIASHSHMSRLDYAYFTKRPPLNEAAKRLDKLSSWEPKVTQVDIPGPKGRRLDRCFSMNTVQDMMLVWWSVGSGEAWPWSPMSNDKERANITILSINGPMIDVMAYTKTECDPVHCQFSTLQPHRIFTLEQEFGGHGEVTARSCTYEIIRGQLQTASVVNIPLKSSIVCQARNPQEDKLLLGLSDASLVMYDEHRKVTLFTRAAVPPASITWHPLGSVLLVASARADIQLFDRALTPLGIQLVSEEPAADKFLRISKFFRTSVTLREIEWCPFSPHSSEFMTSNMDALFLSFSRGPVGLLQFHLGVRSRERFSCLELVKEYVKHKQIDEAVSLLSSMNWDNEGQACYACLSYIVIHLLRMPLNADREAQLETALATFYAPKPAISETTILEYRDPISHLARRFFHHLLRYVRFDKAFLLAVDIGARDLFMDIHYMATDKGEMALAEVAKRKAEQIESEGLDTLEVFDVDPYILTPGQSSHKNNSNSKNCDDYERIIDELPSSRQHPWQQEYYTRSAERFSVRRERPEVGIEPQFSDGSFPDLGDMHLNDDLITDYTTALMGPKANSLTGPRDVQRGDLGNQEVNEAGTKGKVKVIHFGIV